VPIRGSCFKLRQKSAIGIAKRQFHVRQFAAMVNYPMPLEAEKPIRLPSCKFPEYYAL